VIIGYGVSSRYFVVGVGASEGAAVKAGLGLTTSQTILSASRSSLVFSLKTAAETSGLKIGPAPRLAAVLECEMPYL
jgi:hypothetical protein